MVKVTPDLQQQFVDSYPDAYVAVKGAWGRKGSTSVKLRNANRQKLLPALEAAWKQAAPVRLDKF